MNTRQRLDVLATYEFSLYFALPDADDPDPWVEALGEAGCTDTLVGIGVPGSIALDFAREASSAEAALLSALRDVTRAIPGATLVEAGPDLVGLTDIADLLGFSRQNMRKLFLANAATFPQPVHRGSTALWHLVPVLNWFSEVKGKTFDKTLTDVAQVVMQLNIAKESKLLDKKFLERVQRYLPCK